MPVACPGMTPAATACASGCSWIREQFYDESRIAIVPMGFCYPGRGKSGDLPPPPDCAPLWHEQLLQHCRLAAGVAGGSLCPAILPGRNAGAALVPARDPYPRVKRWHEFGPRYLPLPHPSPRNTLWLRRNPWFEEDVVPALRTRVQRMLR